MTRRGPGKNPGTRATAGTAITKERSLLEYRVTWKRPHWSTSSNVHSRVVQSSAAVERFIHRLGNVGELSELHVDVRDCSPWRPVTHPLATP